MEKDDLDYLLPANCPNPYYDTWDRHNSIAFSTATKGLRNAPGENNCFVNSAVQVFWHLDVFRRSYRRLSGHTCMGNSCIFCALKVIFTQFQFSDQSSLHPDALRKALAETFANQQRFQLGHMDDAAECFENILRRIHFHIANNCNEDTCSAPHCLPHQKFSLNIVEKVVCPCGASSNPLKFREMVHYISATALVSQARVMQETGDELHPDRFGLLLRNANAMGDIRDCPGACGKKVQIRRSLLNAPDVVSIGLVWDSDHPSVETTTEVARNIGTSILMQDVFHSVMQDVHSVPKLSLVGLVCYYGKHYSTFVFHSKLQVWIYFDDATVKEIGPRWEHVVDKCSKGRYQPLLLLYANPNATPVSVETAPKKRVMASGYNIPGGPDKESSLDRTHESISSQQSLHRSRTPNPEPCTPHTEHISPRARSVTPSTSLSGPARSDPHTHEDSGSRSGEHSRQQSFLIAMTGKSEVGKAKHPLRYGGQAGGAGVPGPMMPVGGADNSHQPNHPGSFPPPSSPEEEGGYSDYTLSTSDQYRRPTMGGFEPIKLPLTPNQKGNVDSSRKDSFKKGRDSSGIRADVVRYQMDPSRTHGMKSPEFQYASQPHPGQDYDPNHPPALPPKVSSGSGVGMNNSASMFYQGGSGPAFPHLRQRTTSQSANDEAYVSDTGSSFEGQQSQHMVVKPMAGNQNYDHLDGLSHGHTPVQSGLATLPRRRKENTSKDMDNNHQRPSSTSSQDHHNNNRGNFSSFKQPFQDARPASNPKFFVGEDGGVQVVPADPKGLPPPVPNRQQTCMHGLTKETSNKKLTDAEKKAKKLKKELKKAEKKKMKSEAKLVGDGMNKSGLSTSLSTGSFEGSSSNSKDRPEEFQTEKLMYIDRRMVETILKHQGLQRQPSTHSTTSQASSSSIESDSLMGRLLATKQGEPGLHTDLSFDNVSLGSHKDSGYGSSDRNSSSSTGSGTIDPYTQYFISKSMVVPRNLNSQYMDRPSHQMVSDFTAPHPHMYSAGSQDSQGKDLSHLSKEEMNRHIFETLSQRKIMHPIKESSQEDILKILPKEPSIVPAESSEGRPPPIPPKNFAAFQVSKSSHQKEPSLDSLDKDEVKNDYFVSMCEKADELMDKCILAETREDLTAARCFCDSALDCLKEAMNQLDISNKTLVYAQKKHNSCLLKSRSLFKRTSVQAADGVLQGGKRSSITSTDSDNSDKPVRRNMSKDRLLPTGRPSSRTGPSQHGAGHSPPQAGPQESIHSANSRKSPLPMSQPIPTTSRQRLSQSGQHLQSAPSSSSPSSYTVPTQGNRPGLQSHVSRSAAATDRAESESAHSRSGSNSSICSSASVPMSMASKQASQTIAKSQSATSSTPMPLDAYGTLPRNRKPRRTSDPTGNSEVYQMYLNRQKQHMQGSSSSSEGRESDSGCEGNGQKKSNKAEIRELLENNIAQRPMGQLGQAQPQHLEKRHHGQRLSYDGSGQRLSISSNHSQQHVPPPSSRPGIHHSHSSSVSSLSSGQDRVDPHGHSTQSSMSSDATVVSSVQEFQPQPLRPHLHQELAGHPSQHSAPRASGQPGQYNHPQGHHTASHGPGPQYPNPHSVSGYNKPLPGQRGASHSAAYPNSSNASTNYPSNHSQMQYLQNQTLSQSRQMPPTYKPQTDPSHSSTLGNSKGAQPCSVQARHPEGQNLVKSLGHSGAPTRGNGPPPPPPARTISNPDFKHQQSHTHSPLHPHSQVPSVARVQPNSHLVHSSPQQGPVHSACHEAPVPLTSQTRPESSQGLKHAISSNGLNLLPMEPRPLERCASQPDCQNLVDSAPYHNQPDLTSYSFYGSSSNSNNSTRDDAHSNSSGPSLRWPQTSDPVSDRDDDENAVSKPNVRALASKFDQGAEKPEIKPKPVGLGSASARTRSKSESGSKKPKSVLKSKKAKCSGGRPRKSVTFAENMSGYESAAELTTFSSRRRDIDRAYFSDDDDVSSKPVSFSDNDLDEVEDSSNSDDSPLPHEELACQLCRKREMEHGKAYCGKCSFYMKRLVSS